MKYVVTKEGEYGVPQIFIFPKTVNHSDFFYGILGSKKNYILISAGMVNPTTGWICMGSHTLKIDRDLAREKEDEELLQFHANL